MGHGRRKSIRGGRNSYSNNERWMGGREYRLKRSPFIDNIEKELIELSQQKLKKINIYPAYPGKLLVKTDADQLVVKE